MKIFSRILTTSLAIGAAGCFTPPDYSPVPEIEFNSITKFETTNAFLQVKQDSVVITLKFKDGDGDLGESQQGREDTKYKDWGNYELKTFKLNKQTKQFEEIILPANAKIFFPMLKPDGKRGPIEGLLDYSSLFPYSRNAQMATLKFRIRLRDRALNNSNVVESDTISIPLLN